jgi:hypothetical protein
MKNIKTILAFLIALGSISIAYATEGDGKKTQRQQEKLHAEVYDHIDDLDIADFRLTDEVVDIYFTVNENGDVKVNNIEGDNYIVKTYVSKMLEENKVNVVPELQGVEHHIRIRYVVL